MKDIYNEVKKVPGALRYSGETEMLYVLNPSISHAYNVLLFEQSDGKTGKIYLDMTRLLMNNGLFQSQEDIPKRDVTEIWAKIE